MPQVKQSIHINVPVSTVYTLVAHQPERMAEWWPPIEQQERVTPPPTTLGSVSRYVYNMIGVKIQGEHRVEAMTENEHLFVKTTSGIRSAFDFHFEQSGNGTHLTVRVDYTLPGSIIGQLVNKVLIETQNERDLQQGLKNLCAIVEREHKR